MRYSSVPSVLALVSLAAAVPTPEQKRDDPWAGLLDPWGQFGSKPGAQHTRRDFDDAYINSTNTVRTEITGEQFARLAKRARIEDLAGYIPGCSKDDDPSYAPSHTYKLNQGVLIPKAGKDDACTTGHGGDHCWTQYFLVEAAVEYFGWRQTGSAVNCPKDSGSTCSSSLTGLTQECTFTSSTSSNGVDYKILDIAAKLPITANSELSIGSSISYKHEDSKTSGTSACQTKSDVSQCTWARNTDPKQDLCHQVWYADRVLHVWGQAQRTCNKCTKSKVQQNSGDGKVCVRGQKDFDFRIPINRVVDCDGKCNKNTPPRPNLPNGNREPYQPPSNWGPILAGTGGI